MGTASSDQQAQRRKAETTDITENDALTQRHKILTWKPLNGECALILEQLHSEWIYKRLFPGIQGLLQHFDPATIECLESSFMKTDNNTIVKQSERCREYLLLLQNNHTSFYFSIYCTQHNTTLYYCVRTCLLLFALDIFRLTYLYICLQVQPRVGFI